MIITTDMDVGRSSIKLENGVKNLKEKGYKVAILADPVPFQGLDFYTACKKASIKPVLTGTLKTKDATIVMVAKNFKGFQEVSKMLSENALFVSPDVITIVTSIKNPDITLNFTPDFIGADYRVNSPMYVIERIKLISFANKNGIKIFPWEPASHVSKEDFFTSNALKSVIDKKKFDETLAKEAIPKELAIENKEDYIARLNNTNPELLKNLSSMIRMIEDDEFPYGKTPTPPNFKFKKDLINKLGLSENTTEDELFAYVAKAGLKQRLVKIEKSKHSKYIERLDYEISVIKKMKFSGYMLIVQDFVQDAKKLDIPVGPGRGSAAGSLVAYAMGITDLDPLPYGLLFERFLNPDRVSMPDIDMDFCQSRRQEVLDLVIKKYGKSNVAQIVTFGKFGAKASLQDACRISGVTAAQGIYFSKMVPEVPGIKLSDAFEENKEAFEDLIENDGVLKRAWSIAHKIEGYNRGFGVHAAGVVITNKPVYLKAPLTEINGTQVVCYNGAYLEDVDLIKFDFLGLKTLSVIDSAIKIIRQDTKKEIDFGIKFDDKQVYELISSGLTNGVFQIESDGMKNLCKDLQPDRFDDLIALIALYRPGPMDAGMLEDYVARKKGNKEISYFFDEFEEVLKPILETTYGVIVYQEQIMQIVQEIGGFSLGKADIIRRAMGKKKFELMEKYATEFADGAEKKGFNRENAVELFNLIEKFAGYGFNKSHSAAYALLTYQTAYLKAHYPTEFFTALLNFDIKDNDKIIKYLEEAPKFGIEILAPNVRTSPNEFKVIGNKKLAIGLSAIKNVGKNGELIIEARPEDGFSNLIDFIKKTRKTTNVMFPTIFKALMEAGEENGFTDIHYLKTCVKRLKPRTQDRSFQGIIDLCEKEKPLDLKSFLLETKQPKPKMNKQAFESLAKTGALDCFGFSRKFLVDNATTILTPSKVEAILENADKKDYSLLEKLIFERDLLGFYITDPFAYKGIKTLLSGFKIPEYDSLEEGKQYILGLPIHFTEKKISKKGKHYRILTVLYKGQTIEVLLFGRTANDLDNVDITKPLILSISKTDTGGIFFNEASAYITYDKNEKGFVAVSLNKYKPKSQRVSLGQFFDY